MTRFRQSIWVVGVAFGLGALFDYLFWAYGLGVNWPVFIVALLASWWALAQLLRQRLPKAWLALPLMFFAGMVAVRASVLLTLLNIVACAGLLLLIVQQATGRLPWTFSAREWAMSAWLPVRFVAPLWQTLVSVVSLEGVKTDRAAVKPVVTGIVIAAPLLIVFSALFASADALFAHYLRVLIDWKLSPEVVVQVWVIVLATLGLTGAFTYLLLTKKLEPAKAVAQDMGRSFGMVEASIVLGSVGGLFLLFILLQIAYLFGGTHVIAQGVTYAEYARRGFFELLAVAVLSLGLLLVIERFIQKVERGHFDLFKWLASGLIAEVLVILVSAFRRLWLYEEAYGFSTLRLYSHAFTLVLAAILGLLVYKIWRALDDAWWLWRVALACLVALAVMNVTNPDAMIARLNLDRYERTGKLDADYLASLSTDAVPVLAGAARRSDEAGRMLADDLKRRAEVEHLTPYQPAWQEFNVSAWTASRALEGI